MARTPLPNGGTVDAPDELTAETELEKLRGRRADIEYRGETDSLKRAADPAEWRVRDAERRGQLAEIEVEVRRLEAWNVFAITHEQAVIDYEAVSRLAQARHHYVFTHARWLDASGGSHETGNCSADLNRWWNALAVLAQQLPSDHETARGALVRELNAWFLARSAFCAAVLAESARGNPEWPELAEMFGKSDPLPAWVFIGASRGDR